MWLRANNGNTQAFPSGQECRKESILLVIKASDGGKDDMARSHMAGWARHHCRLKTSSIYNDVYNTLFKLWIWVAGERVAKKIMNCKSLAYCTYRFGGS